MWPLNGNFVFKFRPAPFGAFWQLQFGCEMAIFAPNFDLGLLEPSAMAILASNLDLGLLKLAGNYNLAGKWPFCLRIWTWAFCNLLAIAIWL